MEESLIRTIVQSDIIAYLVAALVVSQVIMTINLYLYRGQVSKMSLFSWSKKNGLLWLPIEFFDKKKPPPRQEGAD